MDNLDSNVSSSVQIGKALEDFTYGGKVKLAIPSMISTFQYSSISELKQKINVYNLMNQDTEFTNKLNKSCTLKNYITVSIPKNIYPGDDIGESSCEYKGNKDDKFAISFNGGDLNKPVILRKVDD